jgi:DNA-binding transcriptional regulator YiaG
MKMVRTTAESIYGPLWQSELARGLGFSDRTIRRWVSGEATPPEDIEARLRRLIDQRIAELRAARSALPK